MTQFRTERLLIRPARAGDLLDLHAIYSDPQVMRYWDTPPDQTLADTRQRLAQLMSAPPPVSYFVIEHRTQTIGCAGIHGGDEIGFILQADRWRQGIMSEALETLLSWLFETLKLTQMTADVDPQNKASVACLTRFGFEETGRAEKTYFVNGVWTDSLYLALPRPR